MQLRSDAFEVTAVTVAGWLALVSIPLALGGIGLSWDALNHHLYLGWTAFQPRFDQDWLAASFQSYQYPYLYWPFYKLVEWHVPGMWAGVVLVSLCAPVIPALWLIARVCVPVRSWEGTALRAAAVALALSGQLMLSLMDSTANDVYASVPLVWSVAAALLAVGNGLAHRWWTAPRLLALSGALAGVAVAFKLSNGPLVLALPLVWACVHGSPRQRLGLVVLAGASCALGFVFAYGWWGWEMWRHFGNPLYPFESLDAWFAPLRDLTGWREP